MLIAALLACTQHPNPGPPPPRPAPVASSAREYEVRYGDTLFLIASDFNVPGGLHAIAEANELHDVNWIQAGERLRIEGSAATELSPWPSYARPEGDLDTCDVAVDHVMGGPGLPSGFCPTGEMLMLEAQLDQDGQRERLYGCMTEDTGVGMTHWSVALVDGPAVTQILQLGNFGESSIVEGPRGCELLASSWERVPVGMSESWFLTARRMHLRGGQLQFASPELRTRRLLYSFEPGEIADDLSHRDARVRNIEPMLQGERLSRSPSELPAQLPWSARIGDAATGLLYPVGYQPTATQARSVTLEDLRVDAWGTAHSVYWI
jgi:hypothetical protein